MSTYQRDAFANVHSTTQGTFSADQMIRAWVSAVSDGFAAVGLVQTNDTGQINKATITNTAGGGNTNRGYEIWRFNDALQATAPVFIKVEYGVSANGIGPALWLTVGRSTDGAGTLNNVVSGRYQIAMDSSTATAMSPVFASGDGSSIGMICTRGAINAGYATEIMFFVERSRNDDGTPNGDGLLFCVGGLNANSTRTQTQFMSYQSAAWSSGQLNWPVPFPAARIGTGNAGTSVTLFPAIVVTPKAQGPSLLLLGCGINDYVRGSLVSVRIKGVVRTYLAMTATNVGRSSDGGAAGFLVRWE